MKICFILLLIIFVGLRQLFVTALNEAPNGANKLDCETEKRLDVTGYEAIKALHKSMDDDLSGTVDLSESIEFVREELKITEKDRMDKRQKVFHHNNDEFITVDDLWCRWVNTEERRWTTDEMIEWLEVGVELPQYKSTFLVHNVRGIVLPRVAVQNTSYLSSLGVTNPVHRQKIQLKAMDVVLFGYRKIKTSYWKDAILVSLLCLAVGGYWFAVSQRSAAQREMNRLSSHMDKLKDIETEFQDLQEKFHEERRKKESIEKKADLQEMEKAEEVEMLKSQLVYAEKFWEKRPRLQNLLRRTYELEMNRIGQQRSANLREMAEARDMVEKFRRKQSSLFSQIRTVHGAEMEVIDERILVLKNKLEETARSMDECQQRWSQIEVLSGFSLTTSPSTHVHASSSMPGAAKKSLNEIAGDRPVSPLSFTHSSPNAFAGFMHPVATPPKDFDDFSMESGKDLMHYSTLGKLKNSVTYPERPNALFINGKQSVKSLGLNDSRHKSPVIFEIVNNSSLNSSQRSVSVNDLCDVNGELSNSSSSQDVRVPKKSSNIKRTDTETSFQSETNSSPPSTVTSGTADGCVTTTKSKHKKAKFPFFGSKKLHSQSQASFKI